MHRLENREVRKPVQLELEFEFAEEPSSAPRSANGVFGRRVNRMQRKQKGQSLGLGFSDLMARCGPNDAAAYERAYCE